MGQGFGEIVHGCPGKKCIQYRQCGIIINTYIGVKLIFSDSLARKRGKVKTKTKEKRRKNLKNETGNKLELMGTLTQIPFVALIVTINLKHAY